MINYPNPFPLPSGDPCNSASVNQSITGNKDINWGLDNRTKRGVAKVFFIVISP